MSYTEETAQRAMGERLTGFLEAQAEIARRQAALLAEQSAMLHELLAIERKGPQPAGPARLALVRAS